MEHIEKIVSGSKNSGFTPEGLEAIQLHTEVVNKILNITHEQSVLLSVIINYSETNSVSLHQLSSHFNCQNIRLMCHRKDFDALQAKKLIKYVYRNDPFSKQENNEFLVPQKVIECLQKGEKYIPESYRNITAEQVFSLLETWFDRIYNESLRADTLHDKIDELMLENRKLDIFKRIRKYKLSGTNKVILLFFCHKLVSYNDLNILYNELNDLFPRSMTSMSEKQHFKKGEGQLFSSGLLEYSKTDTMPQPGKYSLSEKAKEELLVGFDIEPQQAKKLKDLIKPEDITAKDLFYNEKEQLQITRLESLLQETNFKKVQHRLAVNGMRKGFTCLFYGSPGTGKTETVYQLARKTGREVFSVDISQTKSMWFGESEKIIKDVFNRYNSLLKNSKIAPVLLFNEADAIIGKRKDVTRGNVAQTENAIQNIILQEIENLEGIMIATTNMTDNFDKAFERRFLYKIEFGKPKYEAKKLIWKTMLPEISDESAGILATRYDLSGGQIENITRKSIVDSIITGKETSLDGLLYHCENEMIAKTYNKIGFY